MYLLSQTFNTYNPDLNTKATGLQKSKITMWNKTKNALILEYFHVDHFHFGGSTSFDNKKAITINLTFAHKNHYIVYGI